MESIKSAFFRGFFTLLPLALTAYIFYSGILLLEGLFANILRKILPEAYYIPGFGFTLTLLVIFGFGLLLNNFLAARILSAIQDRLVQVPFIRTIYSPLRDLMNLFTKKHHGQPQAVVLVPWGPSGYSMGLVTRETFNDLNLGETAREKVAVYIPFSYALGGFTVLVPKNSVKPVDLPIDRAMTLAITGWISSESGEKKQDETNKSAST